MTQVLTVLVVVAGLTFPIFIYSRRLHNHAPIDSVVARTEAEAREADGYWPGKEGRLFTQDEKYNAWIDAKKKCEHCGAKTVYGNVDKRDEYLKALALGYSPSNAGHRVPHSHGGGFEKRGPVNLCRACNEKESNEINDWVLKEVKREGKKIYVGD